MTGEAGRIADLDALGQHLAQAVNAFFSYGELQTLFDSAARFNDFSPANKVLLTKAMPHAAYVATREQWAELGRTISPDAEGVRLMVPRAAPGKDGTKRVQLTGAEFFDVSQTQGPEIDFGIEPKIYREDLLIRALREVSAADGVPVRLTRMNDNDGICHSWMNEDGAPERSISIKHDLGPQAMARTILHEMAHSLLHGYGREPVSKSPLSGLEETDLTEIEAEAAAYIAASHFGIMDDIHSTAYIGGHLHADVYETLAGQYARILNAAQSIVSRAELQYDRELMTEQAHAAPAPGWIRLWQLKDTQRTDSRNQNPAVFDRRLFNAVGSLPLPEGAASPEAGAVHAVRSVRGHPPAGYCGREPIAGDVVEIGTGRGSRHVALTRDGPKEIRPGRVNLTERRQQKRAAPGRDR